MAREPEPCTTWSYNRQHLSVDLFQPAERRHGREGRPLCDVAVVYDQERIDWWWDLYGAATTKKQIASLPLCKRCEKKAAKVAESDG